MLTFLVAGACAGPAAATGHGMPTLGVSGSPFGHHTDPGFNRVKPRLVSAEGDGNSVVSHIRWRHWGSNRATGWGKTAEFAPQGGYLPGLYFVELHAQDLGRCYPGGPLVYRKLARRDPRVPKPGWHHWALWPARGPLC